jgi:hypothetical protein
MDWKNEGSYLIDDDLGAFTEDLPVDSNLTIILDACHSGTGTKAISSNFKTARTITPKSRLVLMDDTINSQPQDKRSVFKKTLSAKDASFKPSGDFSPTFARFVFPPSNLRLKPSQKSIRRFARETTDNSLNHLLLAAARDDQTAADAFIDGDYHGAFSYYLCQSARELGQSNSVEAILQKTKTSVQLGGYSQVPQLEGIGSDQKLFGGEATTKLPDSANGISLPPAATASSRPSQNANEKMKMFARLLDVSEKFLDLGNKILDYDFDTGLAAETPAKKIRDTANQVIVYVHGIGNHAPGYSNRWFNALKPHLDHPLPTQEVVWSDIVNPRSVTAKTVALSKSGVDLKKAIERELEQRQQVIAKSIPPGTRDIRATPKGSGFSWDDFVRYMTSAAIRDSILQRFDRVVRPLLEQGKTIQLISHSWGTVVAYEGLRNLDGQQFPGRVENLFVVGSALSISPVQNNLFGRVTDGRKPVCVSDIFNLDAGGDIVGGSIAGIFVITDEYLGLTPINCSTIPFTNTAWSVSCAHSSYFDPDNLATNRDIFARQIND